MKKFLILSVVALAAVSVAVTAAIAKPAQKSATTDVCVLLPDTKSSVRWEQFDRPGFAKALKAARRHHTITNALGDAQKQPSQADQCLANGAKVVIIASLDAGSLDRDREEGRGRGRASRSTTTARSSAATLRSTSRSTATRSASLQGHGPSIAGLKAKGMYARSPSSPQLWGGKTDAERVSRSRAATTTS